MEALRNSVARFIWSESKVLVYLQRTVKQEPESSHQCAIEYNVREN